MKRIVTRIAPIAAFVAAAGWSGYALSGSIGEGLQKNLLVEVTFGGRTSPEFGVSLRLEQPPLVTRLLARAGVGTSLMRNRDGAATDRLWAPPLAQVQWRSRGVCGAHVNGVPLMLRTRTQLDAEGSGDAAADPGMSLTTKLLLGGAAVAAIALAVGGGGGGDYGGDGGGYGGECPTCNSDAMHQCDGQVTAVCSGGRLDDDGDCSTTCDTI